MSRPQSDSAEPFARNQPEPMVAQAKARQRAHAKLLAAHSRCIYCAGAKPVTTVEHLPPIMMFNQRQRPKELEFPTREGCNHGTRLTDLVASLLGRVYPDPKNDPNKKELQKPCLQQSTRAPVSPKVRRQKWGCGFPDSGRRLHKKEVVRARQVALFSLTPSA